MGVWRIHGSFGWRHDVVVKSDFALRGSVVPAYDTCVVCGGGDKVLLMMVRMVHTISAIPTFVCRSREEVELGSAERTGCSTT